MRMMGRWPIGRRGDTDVAVEVRCSHEPTHEELLLMREYLDLWIGTKAKAEARAAGLAGEEAG